MTVLVVDNYDSFVYNLVQYVGSVAPAVTVRRNDAISLEEVRDLDPTAVILSPGPGHPEEAGITQRLCAELEVPTLGVCLGHQALCGAAGADVVLAPTVVHGKPSPVEHDGRGIFTGVPDGVEVGRYHSLAVDRSSLPAVLEESAWTAEEEGVVMGVRHRERPQVGVQFHPESILTGHPGTAALGVGKRMIRTFYELASVHDGGALVPGGER